MHDNYLLAIAMTVSALGIAGLLFALTFLDVPLASGDDVRAATDGATLRITGDVLRTRTIGNGSDARTIISIRQSCTTDVVIDGTMTISPATNTPRTQTTNENDQKTTKDEKQITTTDEQRPDTTLRPGTCIDITGKKSTYKGNAQIDASRITTCEKK